MASNLRTTGVIQVRVRFILGLLITGIAIAPAWAASHGAAPETVPPSETTARSGGIDDVPFPIDGPPPPVAPAVISRDPSGRATIRAVRLTTPIHLDGRLDEALYTDVPPVSGFVQQEPHEGSPTTEQTDVWIAFDDKNVHVSIRCWTDPDHIFGTELRRDNANVYQNSDYVSMIFDTFYDRRNGFIFGVNPAGGRTDSQATNERQVSTDFNPVWDVAVGRYDGGWVVEAAIPFRSLRYRPGRAQIWGFNMRRIHRWRNETSSLVRLPAARGGPALIQVSVAATLVGVEAPQRSRNLEVKPYAISSVATDTTTTPRIAGDLDGKIGVDAKYGLTQNLAADFTYNTDFAQVEADEQQVNLTRFSLFLPEKRDFFLENQGLFAFGGVAGLGGDTNDAPMLFYSRRIGVQDGRSVPIDGGARVTGRVGGYSLGALDMQTGTATGSNFSVVRVKRDVLRKSSIGVIFTGRSMSQTGTGANHAYGIDATFSFFDNLTFNTFWAQTRTGGRAGKESRSHRFHFDYGGDRYGVQLEQLEIGKAFNPEVGFVRRTDMRRRFGQFRFSPRPRRLEAVRKFSWIGSIAHIENGAGRLELRELDGEFAIEFHNSDRISVGYGNTYEFLPYAFEIARDVRVPVGGHDFASVRAGATLGGRRRFSGAVLLEHGSFYRGQKTAVTLSRSKAEFTSHVSVEPNVSVNWVNLPEGRFTTHLIGSRIVYTMTPLMFVSALLQYQTGTHTIAANVRLRWEYRPGSELFVVYNEQRDTLARQFPDLMNRAFIIKITRLLRL